MKQTSHVRYTYGFRDKQIKMILMLCHIKTLEQLDCFFIKFNFRGPYSIAPSVLHYL
jgi:hypothetical protein